MSIFSMKKRKFYTAVSLCAAVFSLCLIPAAFGSGTIETVAGTSSAGYDPTHEGGLATDATLNSPVDVFVDDTGFYIADSANMRIRKVDLSGNISTVAGNGASGYTEMVYEGKAATSAALSSSLYGVAASGGTFFIADAYSSNRRVFKVESGNITTVENDGMTPADVIVHDGYLYVSYSSDPVVKKINISTGEFSVFAGNMGWAAIQDGATTAKLGSVAALATDSDGNVYIAENSLNRIRKVATDGTISLVAGGNGSGFSGDGGLATSAKLKSPQGVAVDASGNVYIADTSNYRIRKVDTSGYISTVAGNGTAVAANNVEENVDATSTGLNTPKGISVDSSGNLYIADSGTNRIRKVTFTPDSPPEKGDLNADGTVGLADAIAGLKVLAGIDIVFTDVRADVDGDNRISMGDVIAILKYVLDGTPL